MLIRADTRADIIGSRLLHAIRVSRCDVGRRHPTKQHQTLHKPTNQLATLCTVVHACSARLADWRTTANEHEISVDCCVAQLHPGTRPNTQHGARWPRRRCAPRCAPTAACCWPASLCGRRVSACLLSDLHIILPPVVRMRVLSVNGGGAGEVLVLISVLQWWSLSAEVVLVVVQQAARTSAAAASCRRPTAPGSAGWACSADPAATSSPTTCMTP